MFFTRLLYNMLPPGPVISVMRLFGEDAVKSYLGWHLRTNEKLAKWHRKELRKLHPVFRTQEKGLRLIALREEAIRQGISPLDSRYPDIFSVPDIE